jgi:DNA primase
MIDLSGIDVLGERGLLDRLEMRNIHSASGGSEANFSCPFEGHSHGDEKPSAYMNVETTAWFCWGCKKRGNAISFVAEVQQINKSDAQRWLRDIYGIEFDEPRGGSMQAEISARFAPVPDLPIRSKPTPSWLSTLDVEWSDNSRLVEPQYGYLFGRGFTAEILTDWEIGYDYLSDRLTIPVYDLEENLFGIKGRAWRNGHDPKYFILGDRETPRYGFSPYEATEVVFGLNRKPNVQTIVLCEGELNAVACAQVGIERPVAIGMSYLSDRHAKLLVREARECIVFWDPDKAGREGVSGHIGSDGKRLPGVIEMLEPYMTVRVVQDHDCDPAEYLRQGRSSEIIELVEQAKSSLELSTVF